MLDVRPTLRGAVPLYPPSSEYALPASKLEAGLQPITLLPSRSTGQPSIMTGPDYPGLYPNACYATPISHISRCANVAHGRSELVPSADDRHRFGHVISYRCSTLSRHATLALLLLLTSIRVRAQSLLRVLSSTFNLSATRIPPQSLHRVLSSTFCYQHTSSRTESTPCAPPTFKLSTARIPHKVYPARPHPFKMLPHSRSQSLPRPISPHLPYDSAHRLYCVCSRPLSGLLHHIRHL